MKISLQFFLLIFFASVSIEFLAPAYVDSSSPCPSIPGTYNFFGTNCMTGYFSTKPIKATSFMFNITSNVPYSGFGSPVGNVTAQSFENTLWARLNDTSTINDQVTAAGLIDIMLGQDSSKFNGNSQNGIAYAKNHFNSAPTGELSIVDLVNYYDSGKHPGYSVQWNVLVDWDTGVPNAGLDSQQGYYPPGNTPDLAFTNNVANSLAIDYGIVFTNPYGQFYLKQVCANITGESTNLTQGVSSSPPPPTPTPTLNPAPTPTPTPIPTPIPSYTITGNIFSDANKNKIKDASESNYPATPGISTNKGTVTTNIDGSFTINNVLAGAVTVSYTSLPAGYYLTSPLNGPPPSFSVTIGPGCSVNGTPGAFCTAGDITNLNFGITNTYPWFQTTCGDIRNDTGITDLLPLGQVALTTAATCSTPPLAFSGDTNPTFGQGQASSSNQTIGDSSYPELFSSPAVLATAYSSLLAKAQNASIIPTNLSSVCTLTNCTLPNNLAHGIYLATGDVTLNADNLKNNSNYLFLINGTLTIQGAITVPNGSTALFSTAKNIIVTPTVGSAANATASNLDGWFIAGQSFIVNSQGNCTDLRLNVAGSVVVNALGNGGTFQNNRDLCGNDTLDPTVTFTQRLDMILNAPQFLKQQFTISQEITP